METIRPIVSKTHPKDKPSIALLGLAISVGASSILLPQQTDSARSAEFLSSEFSDTSIQNSELAQEPAIAQPALSTPQSNLTLPTPHNPRKIQHFSGNERPADTLLPPQPAPTVQTVTLEPPNRTDNLVGQVSVISSDPEPIGETVAPPVAAEQLEPYQVQAGDTLSAIASAYGVTVAHIVQVNHLGDPNQLQAGESLNIPTPSVSHRPTIAEPLTESNVTRFPTPSTSQIEPLSLKQDDQTTSVQTLKADLTKLRQKYQAHKNRFTGPVSTPPQTYLSQTASSSLQRRSGVKWQQAPEDLQTLRQSSSPVTPPQPQSWEPALVLSETQSSTVATAPLNSDFYQPQFVPQILSPEIPPLEGPEAYLPSISETLEGYIWPAQGVLSSGYGWRWGRMHAGIDIAGPIGTPVVAAGVGVVVYAGWNEGGYGNLVEIQHPDGSITRYAHNDRILVHVGQPVEAGQQISEMGSTGYSTGPHLHFEIHRPGQGAQNPIAYLPTY